MPNSEETSFDPECEMCRGLAEGVERGPKLGNRLIEMATGNIGGQLELTRLVDGLDILLIPSGGIGLFSTLVESTCTKEVKQVKTLLLSNR